MTGTLINETNSDLFLPAVPDEALITSDIFIGVTDESDDTACGVLAAEAVGERTLAIRFMWVADDYRGRGAGAELVLTLMEAAEAMDAASVVCAHSRGNVSDGVGETLERCGFVRDEYQTSPIYAVSLSELRPAGKAGKDADGNASGIKVRRLADIDDKQWQVAGLKWKEQDAPAAGLRALARRRGSYDQKLSFVTTDRNGDITGMLLGESIDGNYELQALSAMGDQAPHILLALIENAIDAVRSAMGEDVRVVISPVASRSMELLEQLTGGAYYTVGETALYTYEI